MQTSIPYFNAVGRIPIAAVFLLSGVSKIFGYEATQGYIAIAGGFMFLLASGPGTLALDNRKNDKVRSA